MATLANSKYPSTDAFSISNASTLTSDSNDTTTTAANSGSNDPCFIPATPSDPNIHVSLPQSYLAPPAPPKKSSLLSKLKPTPLEPSRTVILMRQSIYQRYFAQDAQARYVGTEAEFLGRALLQEGKLRLVKKRRGNGMEEGTHKHVNMALTGIEGPNTMSFSAAGEAGWWMLEVE